jgi:hypothetical protein
MNRHGAVLFEMLYFSMIFLVGVFFFHLRLTRDWNEKLESLTSIRLHYDGKKQ